MEDGNPGGQTARMLKMDKRLRAAADWVTPCDVAADIGCDHGRLGAMLLLEGRAKHLIASDISEKSLQKAKYCLLRHGLSDKAELVEADGLDCLTQKADTVCILGMGGDTLSGILLRGQAKLEGATLVLGAHTHLYTVRKTLQALQYRLLKEQAVRTEGRLYVLMLAAPAKGGEEPYTRRELMLGPVFLRERPACWLPWLERRVSYLHKSVTALREAPAGGDSHRLRTAEEELAYTLEALLTAGKKES
jgi:tRNA (adenine22-N1)-methyltransferase